LEKAKINQHVTPPEGEERDSDDVTAQRCVVHTTLGIHSQTRQEKVGGVPQETTTAKAASQIGLSVCLSFIGVWQQDI